LLVDEVGSFPQLRAAREEIRTSWVNYDPELKEVIENIKLEIDFGIVRANSPAAFIRKAA